MNANSERTYTSAIMNAMVQIAKQMPIHVSQPTHEWVVICRDLTPLRRNLKSEAQSASHRHLDVKSCVVCSHPDEHLCTEHRSELTIMTARSLLQLTSFAHT